MTEEQNTEALKKARTFSDNKDKIDGFYNGYVQATKELEAQIEKMKCCFNCKHSRTEYEHCKTDKHEKWEIKEK
jgi:hypothetical protein